MFGSVGSAVQSKRLLEFVGIGLGLPSGSPSIVVTSTRGLVVTVVANEGVGHGAHIRGD